MVPPTPTKRHENDYFAPRCTLRIVYARTCVQRGAPTVVAVDRDNNIRSAAVAGTRREGSQVRHSVYTGVRVCVVSASRSIVWRHAAPPRRATPLADCGDVTSGRATRTWGCCRGTWEVCGGVSVVVHRGTVDARSKSF